MKNLLLFHVLSSHLCTVPRSAEHTRQHPYDFRKIHKTKKHEYPHFKANKNSETVKESTKRGIDIPKRNFLMLIH
jgi:hypothetical protein